MNRALSQALLGINYKGDHIILLQKSLGFFTSYTHASCLISTIIHIS